MNYAWWGGGPGDPVAVPSGRHTEGSSVPNEDSQCPFLYRPSNGWISARQTIDTGIVTVGHHGDRPLQCTHHVSTVCLPDVIACDQLSQAFLSLPYLHTSSTCSQILAVGTALYHIGKWGDTPIILFAVVTVVTGHFDPVY